ncbi:hypothetical protein [Paenibacillus sp. FSL W8-0194]|uniref:hypothetical protein n=1 Tax=Paenibacillus sp. FSL W8-0194 TaxID=2921711 RepID=UPI0030D8AB11
MDFYMLRRKMPVENLALPLQPKFEERLEREEPLDLWMTFFGLRFYNEIRMAIVVIAGSEVEFPIFGLGGML